jgi:hypothetical protein
MPIWVFVKACPAPDFLDLTFDHRRNIVAQQQATAGAIIVYQITDAN